ncbi:hypothetical protein ACP275_14G257000 [Erythranthe tilingii]
MDSPQAFVNCIMSSELFRIPASFVVKMKGALPKRVILRDRYTNMWEVEVATDGGYSCYFIEGWTQFYEDNSLELKDFMILDYNGKNLFDFRIFGRNSLEKKGVGALKLNEHNTINQEYDDASMDDDHGDDDDDIHDDVDDDDDVDVVDVDDDDDDDDADVVDDDDDVDDNDDGDDDGDIPRERIFKKKDLPDCYGAEIFRSGLAPIPENPFFVSRSRLSGRQNELYILKDVIVDYDLKIPEKIVLVDERGNKFKSKIKKWKDGRMWCTKGWRSLCNVNGINADDTCICEFVREGGTEEYSLLVRVVGI